MNSIGYLQDPSESTEFQYLGVQKARIAFAWNDAKAGSCASFKPDAYDTVVLRAAEHGITLVPALLNTCVEGAGSVFSFPTPSTPNYSVWLEFVGALVDRYGPGGDFWAEHPGVTARPIEIWEVWNEPNVVRNNPPSGIFPEKYASFLVDTSAAIKAVAPGAKVLIGGLAPAGWEIPEGTTPAPSALTFLNAMYNNAPASGPEAYTPTELKAAFDGLGIHPYALQGTSGDALKKVEEARSALNNDVAPGGGDDAKSLAVTELGWPIKGSGGNTIGVSEIEQANWLWGSFSELRSKAEAWNVLYATWWENRDGPTPFWEHHSGLFQLDGNPRMSWCAYSYLTGTNRCLYEPGGYPTQAFATVAGVINGQPGFVTVTGSVTSAPGALSLQGRVVTLNIQKKIGGEWTNPYAPSSGPQVQINAESKYVLPNWTVGVGEWRVRAVFPAQGPFNQSEPSGWHTFTISANGWHIDNLGGAITADPSISSQGSGKLDVFGRGTDNALYIKSFPASGGWGPWYGLGGVIAGGPGAVSWGNNRIDVVARDTGNNVAHWYWAPSWGFDYLGGGITSDPEISSWGPNRLDVFARGAAGELLHKYWAGAGWSGWENMGGQIVGGPGAVSWGPNRIDVVARMTDNTIGHWYWSNGWYYDNLGGYLTSDPDISSWGVNRLDVFARGAENGLWHKWYGGSWSGWEPMGGYLTSGPGAVSWGPNRLDIVANGGDSSIEHWWYSP